MNRRPPEALDSEERLLADQLARLGPHGEPSSALDARILAAAHDAVAVRAAPSRKPRWPVAMGLAASALLAVGIAWQLRPVDEMRSADQAEPLPEARVAMMDEPAAAAADAAAMPMPSREPAPPSPAHAVLPTPAKPQAAPRVAPAETAAARRAPAQATRRIAAEATPAAPPAPAAAHEYGRAPAPAPPPPPAAVAASRADAETLDAFAVPAQASAPVGVGLVSETDRPGFVAAPETTAAIAAKREKARAELARDAAEAAGSADARLRSQAPAKATAQAAPPPPAITTNAPITPASASATRNALKRTDLQLPVIEDTKLPPEDWLERIRLRRDLGDRASAADSLVRFKQSHPFQKVPDDLKELLGE